MKKKILTKENDLFWKGGSDIQNLSATRLMARYVFRKNDEVCFVNYIN
jgi:hypothetical protein